LLKRHCAAGMGWAWSLAIKIWRCRPVRSPELAPSSRLAEALAQAVGCGGRTAVTHQSSAAGCCAEISMQWD
jgi:hypothetical protein